MVCGDFKMLGFLLGLQGGYTKYSCFLCLWNSRADGEHYEKIQWPLREELIPGRYNVIKEPLVSQCRMSIKLHFLHCHLDFFQENLGDFSEEHGERFQQDIQPMERRYQGRWDSAMMGDYICFLIREDTSGHKRKARSTFHFSSL